MISIDMVGTLDWSSEYLDLEDKGGTQTDPNSDG